VGVMKKIVEEETYEYIGEGWMIMEVVKICKCVEVEGKTIEVVGIWKHIEKGRERDSGGDL